MEKDKLQKTLINFFTKYEKPDDKLIHALAEKLEVDTHELEKEIYELLSAFLYNGRYNEKIRNGESVKLDRGQLEKGIEIEKEHTDNELIAQRIAIDHLTELTDYYNRLEKMEKQNITESHASIGKDYKSSGWSDSQYKALGELKPGDRVINPDTGEEIPGYIAINGGYSYEDKNNIEIVFVIYPRNIATVTLRKDDIKEINKLL